MESTRARDSPRKSTPGPSRTLSAPDTKIPRDAPRLLAQVNLFILHPPRWTHCQKQAGEGNSFTEHPAPLSHRFFRHRALAPPPPKTGSIPPTRITHGHEDGRYPCRTDHRILLNANASPAGPCNGPASRAKAGDGDRAGSPHAHFSSCRRKDATAVCRLGGDTS